MTCVPLQLFQNLFFEEFHSHLSFPKKTKGIAELLLLQESLQVKTVFQKGVRISLHLEIHQKKAPISVRKPEAW